MSPRVKAMSDEERTAAFRAEVPNLEAPYHGCVQPGSWLAKRLDTIGNPKRVLWGRYYRLCRLIPEGTPCHGVTAWKRINARRCELIHADVPDGHPEFEALQAVAGEVGNGPMIAQSFCMRRWLRRCEKAGFGV